MMYLIEYKDEVGGTLLTGTILCPYDHWAQYMGRATAMIRQRAKISISLPKGYRKDYNCYETFRSKFAPRTASKTEIELLIKTYGRRISQGFGFFPRFKELNEDFDGPN